AKLDGPEFPAREGAVRELVALGVAAEPRLRAAVQGGSTLEVRLRAEDLLQRIDAGRLRAGRAVEVLEMIGDAAALRLLRACGGGAITRLIVADLSGHGASAAGAALGLRALMRKNINRKDQARLVRALNRQFLAQSQLRRFATAVVATYLTARDTLTVCNAGHPRPLWYHAAAGTWEVVTTGDGPGGAVADLPLGIDGATPYSQRDLPLGRGDLVVLYTDALVETTDPAGKPLQEAGLLE